MLGAGRQSAGQLEARPHRVERARRRPPVGRRPPPPSPGFSNDPERARHARRRRPCRRAASRLPRRAAAHRGIDHVGKADVGGEQGACRRSWRARRAAAAAGRRAGSRRRRGPADARAGRSPPRPRPARRRGCGRRRARRSRRACPAPPNSAFQRAAAAMQSRARAAGARPRAVGASKARIEVEPPVSISALLRRIVARRPAADALQEARQAAVVGRLLGEQQVGVERADRRRLDRDRAPVGAELVGEDLGQAGIDALAELGLRHRDRSPGRRGRS